MIFLYVILLLVVFFCMFAGLNKGLFLEIISFCSLFTSLAVAFTFFSLQAKHINDFLSAYLEYEYRIVEALSFIVLFVAAYLIFLLVSNMLLSGVRMKFAPLIDRTAGAFIGIVRGFIVASFMVVALVMFPLKEGALGAQEDLTRLRNIYLIAPKCYEFLSDKLTSDAKFQSNAFLEVYGKFLAEETPKEEEADNI